LPHRDGVHHIKVPIEVTTLVVAPLPLALDGDAVDLARVMALELGPQIHRSETCYVH
jgi:hypothetical protein